MAKPKRRKRTVSSSRRARSRRDAKDLQGREDVAAYSYREDQIEEALATGKNADQLKAYFGDAQYQELQQLDGL